MSERKRRTRHDALLTAASAALVVLFSDGCWDERPGLLTATVLGAAVFAVLAHYG